MRILDLALKDLSQMFRDKRSLLFIVVMPIAFTFFMGFAYRSGIDNTENADTRIPLALVDPEPESGLNEMLFARLASSDSIRILPMDDEEAMDAFRRGEVAGVLKVPPGFSEQAGAGNEAPQLTLIADSSSAQGQSLYQLLRVPISRLMSAVEAAHLSAEVQSNPDEYEPSVELAWSKWDENSKLSLVRIEQAVIEEAESDWTGGNPYNQASPGILVQFAIFGLITSAQILVQERKTRTLQRLVTTAMKPWEIVSGHLLAMFGLVFLQTAMLVVFGQLALKVNYLREPLGILMVSIALGLWVAAMGLLIGVIANGEDQVILFSMVAMFLFSALGGTWFPLEASGGAFAAIGRAMPSAWAMTGYQNILIRGLGLESAWMPTLMLLVYALGFFLIAVWRFRRMEI